MKKNPGEVLFGVLLALTIMGGLQAGATFVFVLMGTVFAISQGKASGVISIIGITLYIAAWPVLTSVGKWESLTLTCAGTLIWFGPLLYALHQKAGSMQRVVHA